MKQQRAKGRSFDGHVVEKNLNYDVRMFTFGRQTSCGNISSDDSFEESMIND